MKWSGIHTTITKHPTFIHIQVEISIQDSTIDKQNLLLLVLFSFKRSINLGLKFIVSIWCLWVGATASFVLPREKNPTLATHSQLKMHHAGIIFNLFLACFDKLLSCPFFSVYISQLFRRLSKVIFFYNYSNFRKDRVHYRHWCERKVLYHYNWILIINELSFQNMDMSEYW